MQKEELLRILRQEGESSGEALGRRFGVSRAAVSKAVAALRREGYEISSTPNRGYRLVSETDALSRSGILADLGDHPWAEHLRVFPVVDSTNDWLKAAAAEGAPHGTVAVADCQTGGRGRLGRRFDSAAGSGVYLSVLLRPACPAAELMTLTAQAAVAVRRAIHAACGVQPGIKWVNDLLLGGKKICGILTELSLEAESGLVAYAVVGVGINCNRTEFPPELAEIAGSILSQTGKRVDRCRLTAALIRALSALPQPDWLDEYRAACVNLGRPVRLLAPGREPREGVAVDLGSQAELLVRFSDGRIEAVNAGEVSLRPGKSTT